MKFREIDFNPDFDGPLHVKLRAGQFALVDAAYMFGQHRLQLWHYPTRPYGLTEYPDILGPEVDTYKPARAALWLATIQNALEGVSDRAPHRIVQLVWATQAAKAGWDCVDGRFRMDNLDEENKDLFARGPMSREIGLMYQHFSAGGQLRSTYLADIAMDAIEMAQKFTDKTLDEAAAEGKRLGEERIAEGHRRYAELVAQGQERSRELQDQIRALESKQKTIESDIEALKRACKTWEASVLEKSAQSKAVGIELAALQERLRMVNEINNQVQNPFTE